MANSEEIIRDLLELKTQNARLYENEIKQHNKCKKKYKQLIVILAILINIILYLIF